MLAITGQGGQSLALDLKDMTEWCLHWQHSVTGGDVTDCFRIDDGRLVLTRSFLHDPAAAGLGEVPGRGRLIRSPGGGEWIVDIDEPMPRNRVFVRIGGAAINHRLTYGGETLNLSRIFAGERVTISLPGG
ncbi:MAG: DUF1850 domain-containing protein [Roseovarius sp.]|nr:DUF1850 domain-containing protein [Roseovarius sp.]